jgi:hypothetical protein
MEQTKKVDLFSFSYKEGETVVTVETDSPHLFLEMEEEDHVTRKEVEEV